MPKILCIDDDPAMLEVLKSLISHYLPQMSVLMASDGTSGMQMTFDELPDVILLDLMLPDTSGWEICKRLKNDPITQNISIIIITGLDSTDSLKTRSLDAGADAFLKKPFESHELVAQIKAMQRLAEAQKVLTRQRDSLEDDLRTENGRLHRSEERWQLLLQSTNDGIWDWDITKKEVWFSPHWEHVLGYSPGEIPGTIRGLMRLISSEDRSHVIKDIRKHLNHETNTFQTELRMRRKDGHYRWFLYRGQAVWNEQGKPVRIVGTQADIHERKIFERKLVHIAHHDTLTGLPNRTLYIDRLSQSMARAARVKSHIGVLFLDLDGFKGINDSYGHDAGDLLLQQVTKRLLVCVRKVDTVARFGGDEFMIILADIKSSDDSGLVSNRIVRDISQPYIIHGHEMRISISVGVSLFPEHSHDEETLIKYADIAMYNAKHGGKNQYRMYDPQLAGESTHLPLTRTEFAGAIERDEIELTITAIKPVREDMQPLYQAGLHWLQHSTNSFAFEKLINLSEEADSDHLLFDVLLRKVCQHMQKEKEGLYIIPVSARQFYRPEFASELIDWLEEHQLEGARLALSLGENTILQDIDYTTELFARLSHARIRLMLDHFGTGYISLQHFCYLSLDYLKFDPYFVREFNEDGKAAIIVRTMLEFAHGMNMQVVATGVAIPEVEEWLHRIGCDYIQSAED
ncbi:MAG: diguanylate cyclase [Candidatus Cloacimonetes bacterium]|nr:diguanylate cyclase [Candidatus Cloacimonadota bacterium]